ncbi:hypothetical protein [Rhizobium leguminosarum]|uniref:hypothetical protein n=1 Tax=Rhizobium leguminosarum TaxID=384 RepID=UPI001C954765|nr:hypothetical protein [Rhizobium leguminosarum]MBY5619689.1 hypothetical protein [Rhizobium leguminosarum]
MGKIFVWIMTMLCFSLSISASAQGVGPSPEGTSSADERVPSTEPPLPQQPVVATSCKFKEGSATTFNLTQTEGRKSKLLNLVYKRCRFEINDAGGVAVIVDIQLTILLDAEVSHCNAFQLGLLFEGTIDENQLGWPGIRKLITALPVESIAGDKKDIALFSLHEEGTEKEITLVDIILPETFVPSYPDVYWGSAYLLEEDRTGALTVAIRNNTPIFSAPGENPDLIVDMKLEPYAPRGWCVFKDEAGQQVKAALTVTTGS